MKTWKILLMVTALAAMPLAASAADSAPKAAPAAPGSTPAPSAKSGEASPKDQAQLEQQLDRARQQLQEDARRVADLSMQINGDVMNRMQLVRERMEKAQHRGFLGIDLDDDDSDAAGVAISGVTPHGPADKAGLQEGDVITSINGTAFKASGDDSAGDKLSEFMRTTKPGDSLKVAYTRDGKAATATVTAGTLRDFDAFSMAIPQIPPVPPVPPMPALAPLAGLNMYYSMGNRWGTMQLVNVTPGLGQYFGTDKGLLVLHAPKDSALQLQEGDVITQLGGRDPGNAPHAMRILSSYGPGESVKIDIMRKGKPQTLNVVLPKDKDGDSNAFNWSWSSDDDEDESADGR